MISLDQLRKGLAENFSVGEDLKLWRVRAHEAFDPIWRSGYMSRSLAYRWLAYEMKLTLKDCHIKTMDIQQCKKVVELCERFHQ